MIPTRGSLALEHQSTYNFDFRAVEIREEKWVVDRQPEQALTAELMRLRRGKSEKLG